MIDDWLNQDEIQSVHNSLQRGESYSDFNMMCEILVESRLDFGHSDRNTQTHFAVITLCGISYPGKPPGYTIDVRKLRHSFRGINNDESLQEHFKSRLTENVLAVESYTDLNFDDITSIFHPAFPTSRPAVMTASAGASSYYHEEDEEEEEEEQS